MAKGRQDQQLNPTHGPDIALNSQYSDQNDNKILILELIYNFHQSQHPFLSSISSFINIFRKEYFPLQKNCTKKCHFVEM